MNDDFRLGIKLLPKGGKGFSLFYDFNRADILLCSPLGLKSLEAKKEEEGIKASFGFLSSVEVLFLIKPHIFKMQAYGLLDQLLALVNKMPEHRETTNDFTTIREYFLENLAPMYRQTIVYTDYWFGDLGNSLAKYALNYEGCLKNKVSYSCIFEDFKSSKQCSIEFRRMDIQEFGQEFDARFNYFANQIWNPLLKTGVKDKTIVFVNSYAEFVKLKHFFK